MQYRRLGKTGLIVSEIGFGAEWMERHTAQECEAVLKRAEELGVNILDCWMSEPNVRTSLGQALVGRRERWYIQGHIGSIWQDGQYVRTRDIEKAHGGHLEHDFKSLLSLLERINAPEFDREMHAIRILAEQASCLNVRSLENLISYGEYLVNRYQQKHGEIFELPYQRERSDPL